MTKDSFNEESCDSSELDVNESVESEDNEIELCLEVEDFPYSKSEKNFRVVFDIVQSFWNTAEFQLDLIDKIKAIKKYDTSAKFKKEIRKIIFDDVNEVINNKIELNNNKSESLLCALYALFSVSTTECSKWQNPQITQYAKERSDSTRDFIDENPASLPFANAYNLDTAFSINENSGGLEKILNDKISNILQRGYTCEQDVVDLLKSVKLLMLKIKHCHRGVRIQNHNFFYVKNNGDKKLIDARFLCMFQLYLKDMISALETKLHKNRNIDELSVNQNLLCSSELGGIRFSINEDVCVNAYPIVSTGYSSLFESIAKSVMNRKIDADMRFYNNINDPFVVSQNVLFSLPPKNNKTIKAYSKTVRDDRKTEIHISEDMVQKRKAVQLKNKLRNVVRKCFYSLMFEARVIFKAVNDGCTSYSDLTAYCHSFGIKSLSNIGRNYFFELLESSIVSTIDLFVETSTQERVVTFIFNENVRSNSYFIQLLNDIYREVGEEFYMTLTPEAKC